MENKKLTEIARFQDGNVILVDEKIIPVEHICDAEASYLVKAHYDDRIDWEVGERERLREAPEYMIKQLKIDADFFHFGPRSIFVGGIKIITIGGSWFNSQSDDNGNIFCSGNCSGHEYRRTVEFYRKK